MNANRGVRGREHAGRLILRASSAFSVLFAVTLPRLALADFSLGWYAVDGSLAGSMSGGSYLMRSSIGEPETGVLSGGIYSLTGGYWSPTGNGGSVGVDNPQAPPPHVLQLAAPSPNPLVSQSVMSFDLPQAGFVTLRVCDLAGRLQRSLASGYFQAGRYQRAWDATADDGHRVSPGVYFLFLDAGSARLRQKLVVLR